MLAHTLTKTKTKKNKKMQKKACESDVVAEVVGSVYLIAVLDLLLGELAKRTLLNIELHLHLIGKRKKSAERNETPNKRGTTAVYSF